MQTLLHDLRHAVRSLRRSPGFTAVTVLTLALGIGATTAIFSAIRSVLLRPLPFQEPQELVQVYTTFQGEAGSVSPPDFADLRRENHSLSELAAYTASSVALSGAGDAEQLLGAEVSGGFFPVLGVAPSIGRILTGSDEIPDARVVVLSHGLWLRRFGGDSGILDRTIRLDARAYTVVGVMPPGFGFPLTSELWTPMGFTPEQMANWRGAHYLDLIGRLRPGVTPDAALADFRAIAGRLRETYPQSNGATDATLQPLRSALVGDSGPALRLIFGAVGLVLLIACVNVAGLLLVRSLARQRELTIRTALGATRRDLVRQLLVESVLLGGIGGIVGVTLAVLGTSFLAEVTSAGIPLLDGSRVDGPVLIFALATSLTAGLVAGVLPAWRLAGRTSLALAVRDAGAGPRREWSRGALVVAELALALVLLVGAGLLVRSFQHLVTEDLGFVPEGVQTFGLSLPDDRYGPARAGNAAAGVLDQLRALPGVTSAGAIFGLPMTGFGYSISALQVDGRDLTQEEQDRIVLNVRVVTPGYFEAMGIPILRGRGITELDREGSAPAVVLNAEAAELLWPGQAAVGHAVVIGTRLGLGSERARVGGEVVGLVPGQRDKGPATRPAPTIYASHAQYPVGNLAVALRTTGSPDALVEPARRILAETDPDLPMYRVRPMTALVAEAQGRDRLYVVLLSGFAALAVGLAAIGVFGVMATSVAERRREFGVRIALGAGQEQILFGVLRQGVRLAVVGVGCGLLGAFFVTHFLEGLLYGVGPNDPVALVAASATLAGVALAAAAVPAWRAARVDPMTALRSE